MPGFYLVLVLDSERHLGRFSNTGTARVDSSTKQIISTEQQELPARSVEGLRHGACAPAPWKVRHEQRRTHVTAGQSKSYPLNNTSYLLVLLGLRPDFILQGSALAHLGKLSKTGTHACESRTE